MAWATHGYGQQAVRWQRSWLRRPQRSVAGPYKREDGNMPPFILTLELSKKESSPDYRPLIRDLVRHGARKCQPACWLINVANTAAEVYGHYRRFLQEDDGLMVSELTRNHKQDRNLKGTDRWIEKNSPCR